MEGSTLPIADVALSSKLRCRDPARRLDATAPADRARRDRTEIAIQPVEDLADDVLQPRDVSSLESTPAASGRAADRAD